jgi:hypothetical protein
MKLLASDLQPLLSLSPCCTHIKGHGGLKQTIVDVHKQLGDYRYVCKTKVKSFYESIDQYCLMEQINDVVGDSDLRHYLYRLFIDVSNMVASTKISIRTYAVAAHSARFLVHCT